MSGSPELATRIVSGLILGAAVLFITWWDPLSFATMCGLGGFILAREWWRLTRGRTRLYIPFGVCYLGGAALSLVYLRYLAPQAIYMLFALVWSGDIAAYVVGRFIGKHKIAPSISPGKSWEGLIASALATSLVAHMLLRVTHTPWPETLVLGSLIAVIGLAGDLFESALKRQAGVKDSGTLIPGHGGLFDRIDALIPCALLMALTAFVVYR